VRSRERGEREREREREREGKKNNRQILLENVSTSLKRRKNI